MALSIQLGQAANLLFGYVPAWDPSGTVLPFFAAQTAPASTIAPTVTPAQYPYWDATPTITIHETAQDLVSAIYDFGVAAMSFDPPGLDVPSGPLTLGDAESAAAVSAVGALLGLDLTGSQSYMLATLRRIDGTATHPFVSDPSSVDRSSYLTPAAQAAIGALTPAQAPSQGSVLYDSKLTSPEAAQYLEAIYQLGTHFVSSITAGDLILQVFGYAPKQFALVQSAFSSDATTQPDGTLAVTGQLANAWQMYTGPVSNSGGTSFGYVSSYGTLLALSRDPALKTASWTNGYAPQGTPSIFAGGQNNNLMVGLTQSVPIAVTLTPLAALIPNLLVAGPWDRLVKGGLLQKYGDGVQVPMTRQVDLDWDSIFPADVPSFASSIVTPTIDIYQELVDLAKVNLQGGELVASNFEMQSFTSFSQVLEATTQPGDPPLQLPSDEITLVAQVVDMTPALQTPVLQMSAAALEGLTVVCEDMYGSLIFESVGSGAVVRKVALDGFLFETAAAVDPATKRYTVGLNGVVTDPPGAALVAGLKQSIEFSIVASESLLQSGDPNAETLQQLEKAFLLWLAGIIPADTTDLDLANNRLRALYLANDVGTFSSDAVYVPYVAYESYREYVSDLVSEAQTLAGQISQCQVQITDTINAYQTMTSIANLNDNIKQIGGVLTGYFTVLANGQQAMSGYYSSIQGQLNSDLSQTLSDITSLTAKLAAQQAVISQTGDPVGIVQQFQQDYADYVNDQIAQCVVSGVVGLFSLGVSMAAIPAGAEGGVLKALQAIKDVFDKLQAVMQVLKNLQAVEADINDISNLNTLSSSISSLGGQGQLQMPSQVDLLLVAQNVQAGLANVPNTGSLNQDKANLIAAVNSLVIIGNALLQAQAKASQIQTEIANNNRLATINGQQQAQLEALTTALHLNDSTTPPDINSIDLIGMTGQLQYQLKQVLSILAQTLELQDGAIQFEYFGQPSSITSFTLQNLQSVISTQDGNIVNALGELNPQPQAVPDPIKFVVKNVVATKLSGTNVFQFPIHLADTNFWTYDMVRIDRVVANVSGVTGTTTGSYEVHLACQAKPFQDRDYGRQAWTFASSPRIFGPYVYDAKTGAAQFGSGTGAFADQTTHLTPFSLWEVSLPGDVANNQGLKFDGLLVDVELDFYITAHYDDPASPPPPAAAPARRRSMRAPRPLALAATAVGDAPSSTPSLANLQAQMYQNQSVLQGWDAVFNVLEGPVNAFLYQQFQQYAAQLNPDSSNLMTVNGSFCNGVEQFHGFWFTNVTLLTFELSNPLLQFVPGNDSVTVTQNILSGSVTNGTLACTQTGFTPSQCALPTGTVNFTADTSTGVLTLSVPGVFSNNIQVVLTTTGTLPAPLQPATFDPVSQEWSQCYWIVGWTSITDSKTNKITSTTLQLSDTAGGPPIVLTDAGTGTQSIAAAITWSPPAVVTISQNPYVLASVPLAKVTGIVTPPSGGSSSETHTVILDFPSGSFTLNQFQVDPPNWTPGPVATEVSSTLADFYATNAIQYQVQTIDYSNLSGDTALQPTKFVLNSMTTNSGNNILQMLICTTGQVQNAHTTTLNEPIPYDPSNPIPGVSDFMVSLMISTELTFEHIFVNSFNKGGTNLQANAVPPAQDFQAWSADITQGSATGTVVFDNPYTVDGTQINYQISANGDNSLTWSLVPMTFDATPSAGIAMAYTNGSAATSPPTGGTSVSFQYQQYYPPTGGQYPTPGYWGPWQNVSAMAYITMKADYPLQVTGFGSAQTVGFTNVEPTVSFDKASDLQPATGCHCDDSAIKIALLNNLGASVPSTLKSYMDEITFTPISVFALESLLFPADQLITLQVASVPGDLLVVGSFLAQVRAKNSSYNVTISAAAGAQGVFGRMPFSNGSGTGSVTQDALPASISFQYGPIDPAIGGMATYTLNLETGAVSPALMVVVDQPDPTNNPQTVILLPPGYGPGNN